MSALRRIPAPLLLLRSTTVRPLHTIPAASARRAADAGGGGSPAAATQEALGQSTSGDGVGAKGRTGGGEPLSSSSENAVPKPKISNLSVPGADVSANLTKEQKEEVERHNKDFAAKHDHGNAAPDDKVDKRFWSGESH